MKKYFTFLIFGFISLSIFSQKQILIDDIYNDTELTWFGLDFSEARFIGVEGFSDPKAIKEDLFYDWNRLFITEKDKYDLKKYFKKDTVFINLEIIKQRNQQPDIDSFIVGTKYEISTKKIKEIISQYDCSGHDDLSGLGVVFIIESFNKTSQKGNIHIVYFDIKNKEPIFSLKTRSSPLGFGFRNYWAQTIYSSLKANKTFMQNPGNKKRIVRMDKPFYYKGNEFVVDVFRYK